METIRVTLHYSLDEVNLLLTALSTLPFNQSANLIANIRDQALPQLPMGESNGNEVDSGSDQETESA